MDPSQYEVIDSTADDFRFGNITVFARKSDEELVFTHQILARSEEEYQQVLEKITKRKQLNQKNLLQLVEVFEDRESLAITQLFEYPNSDIFEVSEQLKTPVEQIRLFHDILSGLAHLEENGESHGDVRPEYIFYHQNQRKYILLDRLSDQSEIIRHQKANFEAGFDLYVSPAVMKAVAGEGEQLGETAHESDVFSLGMTLVEAVFGQNSLQIFYDKENSQFRSEAFVKFLEDLKVQYKEQGNEKLGEFITDKMLSLEGPRVTPKEALSLLKETFEEELSLERLSSTVAATAEHLASQEHAGESEENEGARLSLRDSAAGLEAQPSSPSHKSKNIFKLLKKKTGTEFQAVEESGDASNLEHSAAEKSSFAAELVRASKEEPTGADHVNLSAGFDKLNLATGSAKGLEKLNASQHNSETLVEIAIENASEGHPEQHSSSKKLEADFKASIPASPRDSHEPIANLTPALSSHPNSLENPNNYSMTALGFNASEPHSIKNLAPALGSIKEAAEIDGSAIKTNQDPSLFEVSEQRASELQDASDAQDLMKHSFSKQNESQAGLFEQDLSGSNLIEQPFSSSVNRISSGQALAKSSLLPEPNFHQAMKSNSQVNVDLNGESFQGDHSLANADLSAHAVSQHQEYNEEAAETQNDGDLQNENVESTPHESQAEVSSSQREHPLHEEEIPNEQAASQAHIASFKKSLQGLQGEQMTEEFNSGLISSNKSLQGVAIEAQNIQEHPEIQSSQKSVQQAGSQAKIATSQKSNQISGSQAKVMTSQKSNQISGSQTNVLGSKKSVQLGASNAKIETSQKSVKAVGSYAKIETSQKSIPKEPSEKIISVSQKSVAQQASQKLVGASQKSIPQQTSQKVVNSSQKSIPQQASQKIVESSQKSITKLGSNVKIDASQKSITKEGSSSKIPTSQKSVQQTGSGQKLLTSQKSVQKEASNPRIETSKKSIAQSGSQQIVSTSKKSIQSTPSQQKVQTSQKSVQNNLSLGGMFGNEEENLAAEPEAEHQSTPSQQNVQTSQKSVQNNLSLGGMFGNEEENPVAEPEVEHLTPEPEAQHGKAKKLLNPSFQNLQSQAPKEHIEKAIKLSDSALFDANIHAEEQLVPGENQIEDPAFSEEPDVKNTLLIPSGRMVFASDDRPRSILGAARSGEEPIQLSFNGGIAYQQEDASQHFQNESEVIGIEDNGEAVEEGNELAFEEIRDEAPEEGDNEGANEVPHEEAHEEHHEEAQEEHHEEAQEEHHEELHEEAHEEAHEEEAHEEEAYEEEAHEEEAHEEEAHEEEAHEEEAHEEEPHEEEPHEEEPHEEAYIEAHEEVIQATESPKEAHVGLDEAKSVSDEGEVENRSRRGTESERMVKLAVKDQIELAKSQLIVESVRSVKSVKRPSGEERSAGHEAEMPDPYDLENYPEALKIQKQQEEEQKKLESEVGAEAIEGAVEGSGNTDREAKQVQATQALTSDKLIQTDKSVFAGGQPTSLSSAPNRDDSQLLFVANKLHHTCTKKLDLSIRSIRTLELSILSSSQVTQNPPAGAFTKSAISQRPSESSNAQLPQESFGPIVMKATQVRSQRDEISSEGYRLPTHVGPAKVSYQPAKPAHFAQSHIPLTSSYTSHNLIASQNSSANNLVLQSKFLEKTQESVPSSGQYHLYQKGSNRDLLRAPPSPSQYGSHNPNTIKSSVATQGMPIIGGFKQPNKDQSRANRYTISRSPLPKGSLQ